MSIDAISGVGATSRQAYMNQTAYAPITIPEKDKVTDEFENALAGTDGVGAVRRVNATSAAGGETPEGRAETEPAYVAAEGAAYSAKGAEPIHPAGVGARFYAEI